MKRITPTRVRSAQRLPLDRASTAWLLPCIVWDEEFKSWRVRYYHKSELSDIELQNTLAANDRSYCDDQDIPWREELFPVSDFQPIDFYDRCYHYFLTGKDPFVPISESREIMKIVETCRKEYSAGL